jgi:hypothetical protein
MKNAGVLTEPINSRMVGNPEVIQKQVMGSSGTTYNYGNRGVSSFRVVPLRFSVIDPRHPQCEYREREYWK